MQEKTGPGGAGSDFSLEDCLSHASLSRDCRVRDAASACFDTRLPSRYGGR